VRKPLTQAKLRVIVDLHARLIALLHPKMRGNQSPRSFASKYMHFHCPVVPIIDNNAQRALRRIVPWQQSFRLFDMPSGADQTYARYIFRFWELHKMAIEGGVKPTVKLLDRYLLRVAERIVQQEMLERCLLITGPESWRTP
jgi:hypothetical protein